MKRGATNKMIKILENSVSNMVDVDSNLLQMTFDYIFNVKKHVTTNLVSV